MFSLNSFKIPVFLLFSVILIIVIRILIKRNSNGFYKSVDKFIERENKANSIMKDLKNSNLEYINVKKYEFPFKEYQYVKENENIIKIQENIKRKMNLKMIRFEKYFSNLELKEMYGINNLEKISLYEEHFKGFIVSLYDWAKELYEKGNLLDCKKILNIAIDLKADISRVYVLLANVYDDEKNYKELKKLKDTVDNLENAIKPNVISHLNKLID